MQCRAHVYWQRQNKNLWFVNPMIAVWVPYPYLWVAVSTPRVQYFLQNCKSNPVMLELSDRMLSQWKALHFTELCFSDCGYSKYETYSAVCTFQAAHGIISLPGKYNYNGKLPSYSCNTTLFPWHGKQINSENHPLFQFGWQTAVKEKRDKLENKGNEEDRLNTLMLPLSLVYYYLV